MQVNTEILARLRPCTERFSNYLKYYEEFNGSFDEFIDLENVSYEDKIWVAKKLLNKNQLVHFGLLCAESVLSIFEEKYPEDKRVRDCIEYLKTIPDFNNIMAEQQEAIRGNRSAAYAAANAAAHAAAYAASAAAYAAANAAAHAAANAAAYAAAYAASAAYDAADAAYAARKNQQSLNLQLLKMAASL
jgi:hypothetical protein